jgi:hypothetical protein
MPNKVVQPTPKDGAADRQSSPFASLRENAGLRTALRRCDLGAEVPLVAVLRLSVSDRGCVKTLTQFDFA